MISVPAFSPISISVLTYLVQAMGSVEGWVLDLLVERPVDTVNGGLLALGDESNDILGSDLEWIRITGLDSIDGLVGDIINADDERSQSDLQRLAELVRCGGETSSSRIGSASQEVGGQRIVQDVQR